MVGRGRAMGEQRREARDERLHPERLAEGGPPRALEERLPVQVRVLTGDEEHPRGHLRELALQALEHGPARETGEAQVEGDRVELLRLLDEEAPRARRA